MCTKKTSWRASIAILFAALNIAIVFVAISAKADPTFLMTRSDAVKLSSLVKPGDIIVVTGCLPKYEDCKLSPYHPVNDGDLTARRILSVEIEPYPHSSAKEPPYSLKIRQALFYAAKNVSVDKRTNLVSADGKCWIPTEPDACFSWDDGGGPYAGTCTEDAQLTMTYTFHSGNWNNMATFLNDPDFAQVREGRHTFRLNPNTAQHIESCHQYYLRHDDKKTR